ncbi:hypothetical protein [Candidatus Amarolinea dominans]|uniref:hypothetical protein n=1 Tax=Candidatus Amarolinea dominans TaxID=3140696 RepID=UPI0031CC42A5
MRGRIHQVFAVVQDEQSLAGAQEIGQGCQQRAVGVFLQIEGRGDFSDQQAGGRSAASSTSQTPWLYAWAIPSPTRRASRVLPQPPAPVRVSSRVWSSASSSRSSANSSARPMKEVS